MAERAKLHPKDYPKFFDYAGDHNQVLTQQKKGVVGWL